MTFHKRLLNPRTERDHVWGIAVHLAFFTALIAASGFVFEWTGGNYLAMSILFGGLVMFHRVGPWLRYRRDKERH